MYDFRCIFTAAHANVLMEAVPYNISKKSMSNVWKNGKQGNIMRTSAHPLDCCKTFRFNLAPIGNGLINHLNCTPWEYVCHYVFRKSISGKCVMINSSFQRMLLAELCRSFNIAKAIVDVLLLNMLNSL